MSSSFTKTTLLSVFVLCLSVNVFSGYQNRNFIAPHRARVGELLSNSASADFNGDGNKDLAVVDSELASILTLYGNGAGNFTFTRNYGVGLSPVNLISGDFTGDGKNDLVGANFGGGTLSLLKNVAETTPVKYRRWVNKSISYLIQKN